MDELNQIPELKNQISNVIYDNLGDVYCYNCRGIDDEDENSDKHFCDDCHRKSMSWAISRYCCNSIAEEIINLIKEGEQNNGK